MLQRINRVKHYGTIQDGDVLAIYDGYDWYIAKMKNRDVAHFAIKYPDEAKKVDWNVPPFSEFYFPFSIEITCVELIDAQLKKAAKLINREKRKYTLWKKFSSVWDIIKARLSNLL